MLTPKECNLLIKYHKANQNKITYDDPADQYNGRRIPLASINNLNIKRIIAKYQYDVISEIWSLYKEKCYPEQTEIMRWPIGVPQEIHIDVMGSEEDNAIIPFTDFASILYLNDNFEDGTTYFEGGMEIQPVQGMVAIFEGMKYWHGVKACKGNDRYTLPIWFTTEWKNMELQSHGGEEREGLNAGTLPNMGSEEDNYTALRDWWRNRYWPDL